MCLHHPAHAGAFLNSGELDILMYSPDGIHISNSQGLIRPLFEHMTMSFAEFIEANPQLKDLSHDEQLNEYDRYLSAFAESTDDWVLG